MAALLLLWICVGLFGGFGVGEALLISSQFTFHQAAR